jgi:hypothetical protein
MPYNDEPMTRAERIAAMTILIYLLMAGGLVGWWVVELVM